MNWYILTAQRICVDTSQREYTDPMGCVWHALQFILGDLLKPYQHNHCSRRTEQTRLTQATRQATRFVKIMDWMHLEVGKLLKVMDRLRSELDWVLQPFGN